MMAGTNIGLLQMDSSQNLILRSMVSDKDIIFKGNDGGSTITAMTIDMSAGGKVGIGKTPTDKPLELYSTGNTALRIQNSDNMVQAQVMDY